MINNLFIIPLEVWVITILLILILPIIIIYLKKHFEIAEISAGPPWIKIVKKKNVVITTPPQIVYHNLPQPDYGHFIGREDEINQIITILRPYPYSQYPIVTVDGIGGIGKTALVLEVSYKYLNNDRTRINENFDAIIWTSAKRTVLTVDGVKQRQQTLRTLDDIYTTISIVLRSEDIIRARSEEQSELVRRALSKQRTLLIVDNLETVDDESVMTFLREIPAPTKVIVTTRHRIDVAYPIRLSDLPWSDARILIDQECKKKNVSLSESEMYTLYSRTSGVPLAIVLTVGKIGFGFSITDTLARLSNPENEIVHYCFRESVNLIRGKPAHQILMALSLFAKPANREILGYVAGLHEYDRDEALVTALKLSLINKKADKFYMLELTRIYCLHELENNSDYANSVIDRAVNHINELLRQTDQKYWFQDQKIILEEGDNIISLFDWALVHNKIAIALSIIKYAVLHLQYVGRRADALNLAWKGIQLASEYGNSSVHSWLLVDAGWILSQQGDHVEAMNNITQAISNYKIEKDQIGVCFAKCFLAQALRHSGEITKCEKLLSSVSKQAYRLGYREGIALVEFEFGKLYRAKNDWPNAYQYFKQAYHSIMIQGITPDIFSLAIQGNYGTASLKLDKLNEAKEITEGVLSYLEIWRNYGLASKFTARMYVQEAEIELRLNNPKKAIEYCYRAIELSRSTNDRPGIQKANDLLAILTSIHK